MHLMMAGHDQAILATLAYRAVSFRLLIPVGMRAACRSGGDTAEPITMKISCQTTDIHGKWAS
jgi:hypothetical protein